MKKSVFIILIITTVVASCKNTEKKEKNSNSEEPVQEQVDAILSTQWMNDIQLNDGSKWEANIETTEGVIKMQKLLKTQATTTIEEYHLIANKLNAMKNKVVKECTMKGASHDNLHIWLYPLIEKVTALTESNHISDASKIKQSIVENLNAYSDYFE